LISCDAVFRQLADGTAMPASTPASSLTLAIKASVASFTVQVRAERRLSLRLHSAAGAAATTTHGPPGYAHGQRQRTGSRR
jgi:hypothetical protein